MMEKPTPHSPAFPPLPRRLRRRARPVAIAALAEEGEAPAGLGEIDDDFDTVELDDVIRAARGGRLPAIDPDGV